MAADRRARHVTPTWRILMQAMARRRLDVEWDRVRYRFDPVSNRRLRNWFLTGVSSKLRLARPLGLPTYLQVEPTNYCNLGCPLCPTTTGEMNRPRGSMDPASFEKLMSDVGESVLVAVLFEWGEPFLNANLCQLTASAKKQGVKVITSTNGHFISDSAMARQVVDSGLDTLVFAVDGASAATYRVFRRGGNFERVLDCFRLMAEAKKAMGSETPLLTFQFVVMRHNQSEIAEVVDVARRLGADLVALRTANTLFPYKGFGEIRPADEPTYQRYEYEETTGLPIRRPNRCLRVWNHPAIAWNGRVTICDCDIDGDYELGNAFRSEFGKIWRGETVVAARQALARGRLPIPACAECMYNYASFQDCVVSVIPLSSAGYRAAVRRG